MPGIAERRPGSILFVGRLVSDKGADLLLQAFNRLQGEMDYISLAIAGDGPDRMKLEQMATGRVVFHGALPQQDLLHLMQTHEIMVVPSRMEPMGMVVAEGLACGCRMVVSNQGGMPEVGGGFCRYFESGNVDSLTESLRLQLTSRLPVVADALQNHLAMFTVGYSVTALEEWLGVCVPVRGDTHRGEE